MMARGADLSIGLATVLALTTASFAELPQYAVTDLGTLGGTYSCAASLNDFGQVTGWSYTSGSSADRAFFWSPETGMINLGTLGGTRSLAYDINNAGQIVGQSKIASSGFWRAFVWDSSNGMTNLGTPAGTIDSVARAINDVGRVAGFAYDSAGNPRALMRENNAWHVLGTLGGVYSQAQAVNASGRIIGDAALPGDTLRNAVLWDSGQIIDLGRLPGSTRASGLDINDLNQVVGWSGNSYHEDGYAFLYTDNTMTNLGTLGGATSRAYAINNAGLITGGSKISSGQWHGFLLVDGVMHDLNELLVPGTGWEVLEAQDINASGQIVGAGIIGGQTHACLLTPIPEPGSLILLVVGGCTAIRRRV